MPLSSDYLSNHSRGITIHLRVSPEHSILTIFSHSGGRMIPPWLVFQLYDCTIILKLSRNVISLTNNWIYNLITYILYYVLYTYLRNFILLYFTWPVPLSSEIQLKTMIVNYLYSGNLVTIGETWSYKRNHFWFIRNWQSAHHRS